MQPEYDCFNHVVIGSSPLMLLEAKRLADKYGRVCVLSRECELGGAWHHSKLQDGSDVEIACHLIEDFPGVYETLATATGVEFVPLKGGAIRIYPGGFKTKYCSRIILLLSVMRLTARLIWTFLANSSEARANRLYMLSSKLRDCFHQWPIMLRGFDLQQPKHGYVSMIKSLVQSCRDAGVVFKTFNVKEINFESGHWVLRDHDIHKILGDFLYVTTGMNLSKISDVRFQVIGQNRVERRAVIIEIPQSELVQCHSYVAFWKHDFATRISRVDGQKHHDCQRYIVELRKPLPPTERGRDILLAEICVTAGLIQNGGPCRHVADMSYSIPEGPTHPKEGQLANNVIALGSSGNLAAGIMRWVHRNRTSGRVQS